ncbi:palmitoyl-acyl carrier protein thioesterase chloroplastic-like, partial [Trifolium medium]|nr:palmitoyl-acyl carrier protein thioesterase chloroplastic-like [Trifolium medium]
VKFNMVTTASTCSIFPVTSSSSSSDSGGKSSKNGAAVTTIFLAAEKQWMMLDWKPRRSDDMLVDPFGIGKIVQDGLVFRQNFSIRSYEIGADKTASIDTLMNHLQ